MTQSDSDGLPTMGEQAESELSMTDNTPTAPDGRPVGNGADDAVVINPHVLRMKIEQRELDQKGQALVAFIRENPIFTTLPPRDQALMKYQAEMMGQYFAVLNERIFRAQNPDQAKEYDDKEAARLVMSKQESQARADREFGQPHHGHPDAND